MSQVFCLFPFVKILARKGTLLVRKGTVFARKGHNKGQKALTSSKQRGIKQSAKHELEWGKIFHSIIWTDLITSKLPRKASSTDVSYRFATHPVVAQPFCGRNSLAVSARKRI